MSYFLLVILIGVAIYYIMKWQSPASGGKQKYSNDTANSGETYGYPKQNKNNYAKWIGGGLGWAFGGPLGAILGYMFGSMMGGETNNRYRQGAPTQTGDFAVSLLALTAAIMKADGSIKKSELNYVKRFYVQNFGETAAKQYIKMLGEILKKDVPVDDVARQIGQFMDYSSKLQLLHFLFGIALADGNAGASEISLIEHISVLMGIYAADLNSIKAMFVKDTGAAYKILGISSDATDEEVKKAFREMAKKFHPANRPSPLSGDRERF